SLVAMYKAAIGKRNTDFYLRYFTARDVGGSFLSWNWTAFLFGPWWYFHRKLVGWGLAFLLLGGIGKSFDKAFDWTFAQSPHSAQLWPYYALFLAVWLLPSSMVANGLYHRKVKKLIAEARVAALQPADQIRLLEKRGGVLKVSP